MNNRFAYSDEQKKLLMGFYSSGMHSTKKEMADKIRECAAKVGVSEERVKVFRAFSMKENKYTKYCERMF